MAPTHYISDSWLVLVLACWRTQRMPVPLLSKCELDECSQSSKLNLTSVHPLWIVIPSSFYWLNLSVKFCLKKEIAFSNIHMPLSSCSRQSHNQWQVNKPSLLCGSRFSTTSQIYIKFSGVHWKIPETFHVSFMSLFII